MMSSQQPRLRKMEVSAALQLMKWRLDSSIDVIEGIAGVVPVDESDHQTSKRRKLKVRSIVEIYANTDRGYDLVQETT